MNQKEKDQIKGSCQSMNKWIGVIEEKFELDTWGDTPTEKMNNVLGQLSDLVHKPEDIDEINSFTQKTVKSWYKVGVRRGAALIIKELLEASVIEESDLEFISKEISWKKGLNYKTFTGEKEKISSQSFKIEV